MLGYQPEIHGGRARVGQFGLSIDRDPNWIREHIVEKFDARSANALHAGQGGKRFEQTLPSLPVRQMSYAETDPSAATEKPNALANFSIAARCSGAASLGTATF